MWIYCFTDYLGNQTHVNGMVRHDNGTLITLILFNDGRYPLRPPYPVHFLWSSSDLQSLAGLGRTEKVLCSDMPTPHEFYASYDVTFRWL